MAFGFFDFDVKIPLVIHVSTPVLKHSIAANIHSTFSFDTHWVALISLWLLYWNLSNYIYLFLYYFLLGFFYYLGDLLKTLFTHINILRLVLFDVRHGKWFSNSWNLLKNSLIFFSSRIVVFKIKRLAFYLRF